MKKATKAVLFDMDGTLLPMDLEVFIKAYFAELAGNLIPHGYDNDELVAGVWQATGAMMKNDGSRMNDEAFWSVFSEVCGERVLSDMPLFDEFYNVGFDGLRSFCGFDERAADAVRAAKDSGCAAVLASNPVFPLVAQKKRVSWAGVDPECFDLITSCENSRFSKPNLDYFRDIARTLGVDCAECLMVGNDVGEDMVAAELGMDTFLVTPWLINRPNADITNYKRGDLAALCDYLGTKE